MDASSQRAMEAPSATRTVAFACVAATLPFALHLLLQSLYGGVVTDLRDALQTGSFGIGIMTVALGVPGVVLQPMAGALVDRLGVRSTMTAASIGYGVCCAWFAMSDSVGSASAARLFMGAWLVFMLPGFVAVVVRLVAPEWRASVLSWRQLFCGAMGIAGSLLATPVLALDAWRQVLGWPSLLFMLLAGAAWVALSAPGLQGSSVQGPRAERMTLRAIMVVPDVRRASLVGGATLGIALAMGGLLNMTVMRVVWQLPEGAWGIVNAFFFVGFSVGAPIVARIARTRGSGRTMRDALVFLAVSLAAWCFVPAGLGVVAACVLTLCCGLGASVNALAIDAAVRAVPRESAGSASAVVTAAGTLAGLVMQFGCMSTTLIPGSTAPGRVIGCALVIIAFVLVAARAAHRLDRQG